MKRFEIGLIAMAAVCVAAAVPASARAENVSQPVPAGMALGTGPYKALAEVDPGLPTHTLYRPEKLAAVRGKMPIVVWGNGACANQGNRFRWFLSELSSYGYLVLAIGPMGPPATEIWRADPPPPPAAAPATPPAANPQPQVAPQSQSRAVQLIDAMNWAIAENSRRGGRFFGKLDPTKIAAMGMSCGGAQAIEASFDPRVTTTVMWNSGLFADRTTMGGGKPLTKEDLKTLHAPIAYISGDETDIAFGNANDDFERLNHVPAFRAYRKKTGHGGTYGEANGGPFGKVGVAWLNWRLKGDAAAGRMFLGQKCGLCTNPDWVVKQKNLR